MATTAGYAAISASGYSSREMHRCLECPQATLCGGGCRSESLQFSGSADEPVCGDWRVRVLCELLAEDRATSPTVLIQDAGA